MCGLDVELLAASEKYLMNLNTQKKTLVNIYLSFASRFPYNRRMVSCAFWISVLV